jgi:aldose 1-epimerase
LRNKWGASLDVINLGAAITALRVADRHGVVSDIVLGHADPERYRTNPNYFGVVVGRAANRIADARFRLNQIDYQLTPNQGSHHLHGGVGGFHQCLWTLQESATGHAGESVTLSYLSEDGEEGYPGNLHITVTYCLTQDNALIIDYGASTDQPTILNVSQHSYFNLAGHDSGDILNHLVRINADAYTPTRSDQIPTGEIATVENTALDLRAFRRIGDCFNEGQTELQTVEGFDHNYVLHRGIEEGLTVAAELSEPHSGRTLKVLTDQPGLQFYTGNHIADGTPGKNAAIYKRHAGLCLETQHFPDSPNMPHFPMVTLVPGQQFASRTVYQFGII